MRSTLTVTDFYDYKVEITLATRLTTAVETLEYQDKFAVERQMETPWSKLLDEIYDYLRPYEVSCYTVIEYFKGISDVLVEIRVSLSADQNRKSEEPVNSEKIAGTVFATLFKHLEIDQSSYSAPKLICERYQERDVKALTVFANQYYN